MTPNATPTPMPAFTPVLSPSEVLLDTAAADEAGEPVDSIVVADDERLVEDLADVEEEGVGEDIAFVDLAEVAEEDTFVEDVVVDAC